MRLLIIEDNVTILDYMKIELEKKGFCVDIAITGGVGEEKAYINEYDLILLDLKLPDKDGNQIVKYLRDENISTPIIIISGCYDTENILSCFNLGADDYIKKPFQIEELIARINAVIRRSCGKSTPVINIGNLLIDTRLREVKYKNKKIKLTSKEYDILEYLSLKYPLVISSEELLEHVYDEHFDIFSSVLRVHITKLRKKIKNITGVDVLVNIRGKGYAVREISNKQVKKEKLYDSN